MTKPKFPRIHINRERFRGITYFLTLVAMGLFFLVFLQQSRVIYNQTKSSRDQVANHTETLAEIESVVTQLKNNNQTNHDTTILFIQCEVDVIIAASSNQPVTKASFNECLANSGVSPNTTTPKTSSSAGATGATKSTVATTTPPAIVPSTPTTPPTQPTTTSEPPKDALQSLPLIGGLLGKLGL